MSIQRKERLKFKNLFQNEDTIKKLDKDIEQRKEKRDE